MTRDISNGTLITRITNAAALVGLRLSPTAKDYAPGFATVDIIKMLVLDSTQLLTNLLDEEAAS